MRNPSSGHTRLRAGIRSYPSCSNHKPVILSLTEDHVIEKALVVIIRAGNSVHVLSAFYAQ
jgi:hypothetical protein